ncbi:hypothetical protein [Phaeocystidibacter marisrubri]|uniref:Uncharacterized protein n=1 Tax=Phaeocystidibacter marisrubri TaxID=1577780 RepID=A0A6L3ZDU2_9FLAO|nr:hypothetical protein [Phaeocystidibacter marisrubri]KAB2815607.1 hypothetical protein F8C82_07850 [Phaeocystidibacter marisrubri]GGH64767.1 hypothetical protein GCM10011318_01120 [Phaeocystidibacter marisrubri]
MKYQIEDLQMKNDSQEEQFRTRAIFEDLFKMAKEGKPISAHERNYVYSCLKISLVHTEDPDTLDFLNDAKFKSYYLSYFHDITGGSKYYKPHKTEVVQISPEEARKDLAYLIREADKWYEVIQKTNHSNQLLQQCSKQCREDIQSLDDLPEIKNDLFAKGRFYYRYKKWAILLQSKHLFHIAEEILEKSGSSFVNFTLCNQDIEMNEYSIIHILNRHYSKITKQYETGKSYHNEDFYPRQLDLKIQEVFDQYSTVCNDVKSIDWITFELNEVYYSIWTGTKTKQVKGTGNVTYRRLNTFYPVTKDSELNKIKEREKIVISPTLNLYI